MTDIRPFAAYRPAPGLAARVASPPYDVLDADEARSLAGADPLSFLHVIKAEIDLSAEAAADPEMVYARSAGNLERMLADGVLVRDTAPAFYIYRLTLGRHVQSGVAAGCSVDEYVDGRIKTHELTRRDKEDDRARHMEVLGVNAGPVLCTYWADDRIKTLVAELTARDEPDVAFTADDGVGHAVWPVLGVEEVAALQAAFAEVPTLYVADGHHRSAAARRVRDAYRACNPAHTGNAPYDHFLAVLFPHDELRLKGYHRVVRDLNGMTQDAFLAAASDVFDLEETKVPEPTDHHSWGLHLAGRWYRLTARPGSFPADDPVRRLDAAVLQDLLLGPVLGIDDPRRDPRIDFVGGNRGISELERRSREDMAVAFAFAPADVAQIMAVADRGGVMPPKSTWFEPKLRSGLIVRSLAD